MLRTIFISIFLSTYILIVGPPLILYTLITNNPDPIYWAGINGVMFFVRLAGVRVRVVGTERIPAGTCLFIANHTSAIDAPAVVGAIPRRIAILLKESLFRWPVVGRSFLVARFIPVDRASRESAIASVDKATVAMRNGQSFLIYPEGTRSPNGRLQEFKRGAVVMAINAGVHIVPVACSGAHRIMEKKSLKIRSGEILVEFLPAIDASKYSLAQREELNRMVHDALAKGLPEDQRPLGSSPGPRSCGQSLSLEDYAFDLTFRLKFLQLALQLIDAFLQLRQAIQSCGHFQPQAIVDGRAAGANGAGFDVARQATLGGNNRAIAYRKVTGTGGLAGEDAIVTHVGRAGEADLSAEQGIRADF